MRRVILIALLASTLSLVPVPPRISAGTAWTVRVGSAGPKQATQALLFLPKQITINEGDTVQWALGASDHTIYFPAGGKLPDLIVPGKMKGELLWNPVVFLPSPQNTYDGTGPVSGGALFSAPSTPKSYSLTLTKAGIYKYVCMFHPGMEGTVTVRPSGSPYPKTQDEYNQIATQEAKAGLAKAQALLEAMKPAVSGTPGKRKFTLTLPGSVKDAVTVYRFPGEMLTISRGDTVTWGTKDPTELHTVTFGAKPGLDLAIVKPQPQGPPLFLVAPEVMKPAGGKTHRGPGYYNSGYLLTEGPGVRTYTLTFSRSGTYQYVCVTHQIYGMKGTVVVK